MTHALDERSVGAVTVRHLAPAEGDDAYRSRLRGGPLEIEHTVEEAIVRAPGPVTGLIAVLALLLLVFAIWVRSIPAIGAVGMALFALGWLFFFSRTRPRRRRRVVRLDDDALSTAGMDEPFRAPVARVEGVGVGRDAASMKTLWVRVSGRGRVLLLAGLDGVEASAAADAMREALGGGPTEGDEPGPSSASAAPKARVAGPGPMATVDEEALERAARSYSASK
ncbi:MAG TPA: hypothetical protein RMH99_03005 [Sandaracinaceae bacterium LLY-WYZ-13_1]|nr:hypothetical protein [Sandaracinaceae bacterium LLY-WYZ-13_1]